MQHSVQLELEAVERQIHELLVKQAQLRKQNVEDDENIAAVAAVVIHAGVNDTKLRQTETPKRDFRSLIETIYQKIVQIEVIELEKNSCMKKSHCQPLKHTTVKLTNFLLCLIFLQSVTK